MTREQEAWISQIRKGAIELVVLAMLAERPRYGSQLVDELGRSGSLAITAGTVYPLLSRMRKAGTIESSWQESPVGPPRKYYRLTAEGDAALRTMAGSWRDLTADIETILSAVPR